MHGKHSQIKPDSLLLGCILFLIVACSSKSTPARIVQTITPALHGTSPSQRTGSTTLLSYTGHTQAILSLAWSPNGQYIASGSNDTTVHIWDAATGKRILIYHGHKTGVTTISWSPDSTRIASGSGFLLQSSSGEAAISDNIVQVWDAHTGKTLLTYRGHSRFLNSVAWSPDGTHIASASDDGTVRIWDAHTGKTLLVYSAQMTAVWSVAWSPDGKRIASGGGTLQSAHGFDVQIWNAATGQTLLAYTGQQTNIWAVGWSPDGKRIASSDDHGTVHVWDASTGGNVFVYTGSGVEVFAAAWSPDGTRIASGGSDSSIQVWNPE